MMGRLESSSVMLGCTKDLLDCRRVMSGYTKDWLGNNLEKLGNKRDLSDCMRGS